MHTEIVDKKIAETSKLPEKKSKKLVAIETNNFFEKKAEKAQAFLTKNGFPEAIMKPRDKN